MGESILLPQEGNDRPVIDIDYNEIVYMTTRITDPACVAIIEVVLSKINRGDLVPLAQYGYVGG